MPISPRKIQQIAKHLASHELTDQAAQLEERFQNLTAEFRAAQLQFNAVHTFNRAVRKERQWLQQVVNIKQQVIEKLLPYYPHPLTPDLLYAIELY